MKQYCRYCQYCIYGDVIWCGVLDKIIPYNSAKAVNHCKHFVFNEIDALSGDLSKKYKPRKEKQKDNQLLLFQELNKE